MNIDPPTDQTQPASASAAAGSTQSQPIDLARIRKEYGDLNFDESMIPADGSPFSLFREWLDTAVQMKMVEPNACALATVNAEGRPSNRFLLLKDLDDKGFVFFTNYESRKGEELANNPYAAMTFWWGPLEKSVRIEGKVEKIAEQESNEYFAKRPRGAELGAWSSNQSRPIADQQSLKDQYSHMEKKFEASETIPRPEFWGGYRLVPDYVEFWKGRRSRLHDRIQFTRDEGSQEWKT
jgi:pyridoxamine 5'-phosphate oxidase